MRKYSISIAATAAVLAALFSACNKEKEEEYIDTTAPNIIMTTAETKVVWFALQGTGRAIIDWGFGEQEEITLSSKHLLLYGHNWADSSSRTVTVTGRNIIALGYSDNLYAQSLLTDLDVGNAPSLTSLSCFNTRLTGLDVSRNTNLVSLNCPDNRFTSLDLSNNTELEYLSCGNNQLAALDLSGNSALKTLDCRNNQLTGLDLNSNSGLESLLCDNNQLAALDVSGNSELKALGCRNNQLTSLDVSSNIRLDSLWCGDNQLAALDLSGNSALKRLDCRNNQLTGLDVNNNISLEIVSCYGNLLTGLDVSGCGELYDLDCGYNYMDAEALDALFGTLHSNDIPSGGGTASDPVKRRVTITDNGPERDGSGAAGCDPGIAKAKGWTVQ